MTTIEAERDAMIAWGEDRGLEALAAEVLRHAWDLALRDVQSAIDWVSRHRTGRDRAREERAGIAALQIWAKPPEGMEAAAAAPARGPMRLVDSMAVEPDLTLSNMGEWSVTTRADGQRWEAQCQLSVMVETARQAHVKREGSEDGFVAPFTPGQVQMGRRYAMLVERHEAGGMKCTSPEARTDGGGHGGSFMDAFLSEGRELDAIRRRIGTGQAMVVRRVRPSARGSRLGITDQRLVDMVCLGGMDLTAVLEAHGWCPDGKHRAIARAALAAALDRAAMVS